MTKKLRKPLSIILSLMMILSVFTIIPMRAYAASDIYGDSISINDSDSVTLSNDMNCRSFSVSDNSTLTINQGVTLTLDCYGFNLINESAIELHGTMTGAFTESQANWGDYAYINVYLSDGAKYTVTGLSCMSGDNYLVYYGYDAATDGNGTVSVKNGSTDVVSTSTGYKTTSYTFNATPSSGYKFKNWTKGAGGEVIGTDASINVTCEENGQYQVYANFEEDASPAYALNKALPSVTGKVTYAANFEATAENVYSRYIVTFAGNGKTKEVEVTSFPCTFKADWWNENGELDKIVKELYNFSGYCSSEVPTSSDSTKVTGGLIENYDQYITINSAFSGTVTVNLSYYNDETDSTINCTVEISVAGVCKITWKNYDGTTINTTDVKAGSVPTHAAPTKADDDEYIYEFSGWTDGKNTYGLTDTLPAATGDVTYTAVFNSTKKYVAVAEMINALPTEVTVDDKDAIEAARAAYDALIDSQKALVDADTLAKLTAAEEALTAAEQAVADQAAAEEVAQMINALPAEVTVDDKDAVEAARAAYEALSDSQKALVDADTLAKLTAAEEALIPKLVNESYIENDVNEIVLGKCINVYGAASGGKGEYAYAFYYRKSSSETWHAMAPAYTTESASCKPSIVVNYEIKVVAKDARGTTEEKIFPIKVNKPLTNDSTINAEKIVIGEEIVVTGAASGGANGYTYSKTVLTKIL